MLGNSFIQRSGLSDAEAAILIGLRKYGRRRTFMQVLEEAGIYIHERERFHLAFTLEEDGLIESVTYTSPMSTRAELTLVGRKIADSLEADQWLSTGIVRAKAFH